MDDSLFYFQLLNYSGTYWFCYSVNGIETFCQSIIGIMLSALYQILLWTRVSEGLNLHQPILNMKFKIII